MLIASGGHLEAKLDPINYYRWKVSTVPELDYRYHGFTEQDLNETSILITTSIIATTLN